MGRSSDVYGERVAEPVLPRELDGYHALALPAGSDVRALAAAWFAEAAWEVFPLGTTSTSTPLATPAGSWDAPSSESRPGRLRLTSPVALVGPWHVAGTALHVDGLAPQDLDLYALDHTVTDGLVLGWVTAAARRAGGAVVSADRKQVIAPDPAAAVDLTLWTGAVVSPADLVAAVRPFLAGARMGDVRSTPDAPAGVPAAYSVTARFEFDGALTVSAQPRDAVPIAVAAQSWGEHGPWTYRVSWVPPDPAELAAAQPSRLHLIARNRVAPVVARAVRAMQQAAGGVVVDDGGFPVDADELVRRGSTL